MESMVTISEHSTFDSRTVAKLRITVVVEKPFTTSSKEADRLIGIAKETGKILTTFQSENSPLEKPASVANDPQTDATTVTS